MRKRDRIFGYLGASCSHEDKVTLLVHREEQTSNFVQVAILTCEKCSRVIRREAGFTLPMVGEAEALQIELDTARDELWRVLEAINGDLLRDLPEQVKEVVTALEDHARREAAAEEAQRSYDVALATCAHLWHRCCPKSVKTRAEQLAWTKLRGWLEANDELEEGLIPEVVACVGDEG